ncbi:MAG: hypothetical protein V1866_02240 [archaeon]
MVEKRGEVESSIENKLVLKKAVDTKIKHVNAKAFISEREVYDLVRGFFKRYLDIDYEFTCDELIKELRRVYLSADIQARVKILLDRISEIEHLSREFSKQELQQMLADFKELVDMMIVSHYEKHSFLKRLGDWLAKPFSHQHKEVFDDSALLSENERLVVKMNMLLDNAKRISDLDISKAKEIYKELIQVYDSLDPDRKQRYYKPVNELYSLLKNKSL